MRGTKKEMEYPDAPSGFVTLYNYKEPFMKYEKGYGYQGVLLFDGEDDKVQCHFCGEWFESLGHHVFFTHRITAKEYKKEVGLSNTSALIGDKYRARLIKNGIEARKKNLRSPRTVSQVTRDKIRAGAKDWTVEKQNRRGTCPEQLIDRLRAAYKELGRTPSQYEVSGYSTFRHVFGSFKRACEIANIPYRKPSQGRLEERETTLYSNQELLKILLDFKKQHGRKPSHSDFRRQLLPAFGFYRNRWGSLKNALEAAENKVSVLSTIQSIIKETTT